MATFSPSPAPRRSSRLKQGASPPRRTKVTLSSKAASRLATPLQNERMQITSEVASLASEMDIDDRSTIFTETSYSRTNQETIFANSEELTASFYANLPVEVKQISRSGDFDKHSYFGTVDTLTGFSIVTSVQTCFVWQHAQAIKGTPTCYIFSCPREYNETTPPYPVLVPHGTSREPGLIIVSSLGQIRFWESIGIGLAGGDHYASSQLALSGETVNNLVRSDAQTFVVSTTGGKLFRLTLTSTGGKYNLNSHVFSRPSPRTFSNLLPSIFTPTSSNISIHGSVGYIDSIALGSRTHTGERELWTFAQGLLHKWVMKSEGWEELVVQKEMSSLLEPAVRTFSAISKTNERLGENDLDLELLDAALDGEYNLAILLSYAGSESEKVMSVMHDNEVKRIYALAWVSTLNDGLEVKNIKRVPYQSTFRKNVDTHARIQLLFAGALVSVQFSDAVAICSRDSNYQDRLELKAGSDRVLGVGVDSSDHTMLLLAATNMMKVRLNFDNIRTFNPETGHINLIKSIMMQAILYGAIPDNPLQFSFPPEVDEESLMQGAEQLSTAVLQSDPEIVRKNHDLSAQISGRKERLSWLIQFINDNGVLGKVSQRTRQKLATDAEKLYACHQLWLQYNELLSTGPKHSVLNDAVHAYMEQVGDGPHDDVMRAFFRLRASDVGQMIRKVMEMATLASRRTSQNFATFLPEANTIIVTVLRSAFDYRAYNLGIYGIQLPMFQPWTSRPAVIDTVLALFDATTKAADFPDPTVPSNVNNEAISQLPDLAAILFQCIRERLDWLDNSVAPEDPSAARDKDELEQKFQLLRPEVLETLHRNGYEEAAFSLAEQHRDFSSLAVLCHRGTVYPPDENPNVDRIKSYINRFKEEFTKELYQWYIQHGELRVMFSEMDGQRQYIDKFFSEKRNDAISWIHYLGISNYGSAAASLLDEATRASNLETKHLMLSIGKLAHLAQIQETNGPASESVIDTFHDQLDFVSVHEVLLSDFKSALETVRGRQTLDNQIDTIMKAKASNLSDKPAFSLIFKDLLRQLLQGKTLPIEDIIDLLTLKDNDQSTEDFTTALHLIGRATGLPDARKSSALRSIWRRILIHDDWDAIRKTADVTDAELSERFRSTALYATLCAILQREDQGVDLECSPDESLMVPSTQEITSRWSGISPGQIDDIVQDYNAECDTLGELELHDVYHRVHELAEHTTLWNEQI